MSILFSLSLERIKKMKMKKKQMNRIYVERNEAVKKGREKQKRRKQEAGLSLLTAYILYILLTIGSSSKLL
jgi:hypothetical protein